MAHPLETTIHRLPELLEKNAPTMMRRMTTRMNADLTRQDPTGKLSQAALFLRVAQEDLVVAFVATLKEAFAPRERGMFDPSIPMSLDLDDEAIAGADPFAASTAAFHALCETTAQLGIHGAERYRKEPFVTALKAAFERSRIDPVATEQLMPFARAALDAELGALYKQLRALGTRPGA